MALARAVTFEGVDSNRMAELSKEIQNDPRPDDIPATEILMLHDESSETSLVVLFFENEDDYAAGDAALNAMTTDDTPGRRTSVTKYTVAGRMTAELRGRPAALGGVSRLAEARHTRAAPLRSSTRLPASERRRLIA